MSEKFIGKYKVLREIGKGGTARVYKVLSPDGSIFALKYLFPFPELTERWKRRFAREFNILSKLNHPHLIRVYEFEEDLQNETIYYTMDFIEGDNLWRVYRDNLRKLSLLERLPPVMMIMSQVAVALDYIHSRRVIHKDLKPANILIDKNSKNAYLADFGLAREIRESSALYTHVGFLGTLGYSAPELLQQHPFDERADIYSWGVIFYTLLADRRPIPVEKMSIERAIEAVLYEDPPPIESLRPEIPGPLADIINRCLARDPAERYRNIRQLWRDFIPLFSLYLLPEKSDSERRGTSVSFEDVSAVNNSLDSTVSDDPFDMERDSASYLFLDYLVGREEEISIAIEAFERLQREGAGGVTIFYGLPGMGKSSLAQALGQVAQRYFSAVYSWSWKPVENPFAQIIEFLRPKLLRPIPKKLTESYSFRSLKRFLPQAFEIFSPPPPSSLQNQIPPKELSKWISEIVSQHLSSKGEVWIFDDFQNLPPYALEVFESIFSQLGAHPLLSFIFIGYTPENTVKLSPFTYLERRYLLPLSEEEEAALIQKLAGKALSRSQLEEIHQYTKGVPARISEIITALDTDQFSNFLPTVREKPNFSPFQAMVDSEGGENIDRGSSDSLDIGEDSATAVMKPPPIELFYRDGKDSEGDKDSERDDED